MEADDAVTVEAPPETPPAPVRDAWPSLLVPWVSGAPLSQRDAERIYEYVTGTRVVNWRALAERPGRSQAGYLRDAEKQDARVRACAAAFLCIIARVLDTPAELLEMKTPGGAPVDMAALDWNTVTLSLRGGSELLSLSGEPPRLGGDGA